ncbi:hypothetical protein HMPREF9554_03103 [Treponema phagedenis F0421]|nr:hypothetical protein HMPREF9554_03103 [Treponema phagedenis F0421]
MNIRFLFFMRIICSGSYALLAKKPFFPYTCLHASLYSKYF